MVISLRRITGVHEFLVQSFFFLDSSLRFVFQAQREIRSGLVDLQEYYRPVISNPPPFKVLNVWIPIIIPIKGGVY